RRRRRAPRRTLRPEPGGWRREPAQSSACRDAKPAAPGRRDHPVAGSRPYQCRMRQTDDMQETTDDALMAAYAAGDVSAFEALYARHHASLYRFVRRLLGPALASQTDEVFQDTWLRVVHARAQWQPQGASFRTWLFTLAHHRVVDLWRKSGREVSLDLDDDAGPWEPEGGAWQQWPA